VLTAADKAVACCVPRALQGGGLPLLLELLESKHINLQHNAAFALYGISDNEDNIPCIIQVGPNSLGFLSALLLSCIPRMLTRGISCSLVCGWIEHVAACGFRGCALC
jgi:hypothetical protein